MTNNYTVYKLHKLENDPTEAFDNTFGIQAWNNVPILQFQSYLNFFITTLKTITERERYEYIVRDNNSNDIIAAMTITSGFNPDVGPCISVQFAYSTQPNLLAGGYKWMYRLAKDLNIPVVITTKLIHNTTYELKYRKL